MTDIIPIPITHLDDVWPHVWPHLSRGVEVSGCSREELAADILADRVRVWVAATDRPRSIKAAWLSRLLNIDGRRTLALFGLGGREAPKWIAELEAAMIAHAKAEGCASVRFNGKRGWLRHVPDCKVVGEESGIAVFERAIA